MSSVFGSQILGRRENQEDGFRIELQNDADPGSDILMVLADGMGGHAAGEVASRVALDAFLTHFLADSATRPLDRLEASLHKANEAIAAQVARAQELAGMGCTLIACLKLNDGLAWVSVGDSLLMRARGGELQRLNADHSVYGELIELVRQGRLSAEEAGRHPQRHALRSAVMGSDMPLVDLGQADFAAGDIVLLASDGIETLDEERIARLLDDSRDAGAEEICERLLAAVEGAGRPNQDNTTVIALRLAVAPQDGRPTPTSDPGSARDVLTEAKRLAFGRPLVAAVGGLAVLLLLLAVLWPASEPSATTVRQAVTEEKPSPATVGPAGDVSTPKTRPDGAAGPDGEGQPAGKGAVDAKAGALPPTEDASKPEAGRAAPPETAVEPKPAANAAAPPDKARDPGAETGGAKLPAPAGGPREESEPASEAGPGPGGQGAPKDEAGSDDVPASRPGTER